MTLAASGGGEKTREDLDAELAVGRTIDYEDMRSSMAEKFGWTYDVIDAMDFDRIEMAWRHVRGKTKREPSDECRYLIPRTWREYLSELLTGVVNDG